MMMTQEITLAHRQAVEKLRQTYGHELSSHAFASLFLWRKHMGLSLHLAESFFTVKCLGRGKNAWFFPCGDSAKKRDFIAWHLEEDDFSLCYLRDEDKAFLEECFPDRFAINEDEGASEYIYERESLEKMSGGQTASMRKQINRLQKEHELEVQMLSGETVELAWKALREGYGGTGAAGRSAPKVPDVPFEVLAFRRELGIFGVLVFVDRVMQGMALGFSLTEDTVDGCMEYANPSFRGLSYFSKRAFLLYSDRRYQYLNAEEDLGLQGLRMAKRHMGPIRQNAVWTATPRPQSRRDSFEENRGELS